MMAGGHKKISTGHIDSKFGISIHQMPLIKRLVDTMEVKVIGIHMHNGSDIVDSQVFMTAADVLFNTAETFKEHLEYLDFGSGFKVKYYDRDVATDIPSLGKLMSARFKEYCKMINRDLKLYFEPGKYLVSEAGSFLCTCNQVKQTTSTVFIGVNSGFSHLIRPMFYDAYHDIINISADTPDKRVYTVVGHICETDTFGINRLLPDTKAGDILCIKNAGAYAYEMSSNYNAHGRPAEVMIEGEKMKLIRRAETFDDLLHLIA
jgi:diaminopimelate decarboxylase